MTAIVLAAVLASMATGASGTGALQERCGDAVEIIQYAAAGLSKENEVFSLKKHGETYFELFVSKADLGRSGDKSKLFGPWRLAQRQGDSTNYCIIAGGDWFEGLMSLHLSPGLGKKYGMPGSGYQRCSDDAGPLSGMDVRIWANKELGDSFVLFLTSEIGQKDFYFLLSHDQNWILLDSDKADSSTCYYSRGDDTAIHTDYPISFPVAH